MSGRFSSRRGVALLLTLLVIGLVSAAVVSFIRLAHIEASVAENVRDFTQAEIQAEAGLQAAMTALAADRNNYDAPTDIWGRFDEASPRLAALFEDAQITGRVIDLSGRFNVNYLLNPNGLLNIPRVNQINRLFALLKIDPGLVEGLLDWLDRDDDPRPRGAENTYYTRLPKPYFAGNGRFVTTGQVGLVKGMTSEILHGREGAAGLLEFITVHGDGKININSAPELVLMSLDDGVNKGVAAEIMRRRAARPFTRLDEVKDVPGLDAAAFARITGLLTVQSSNFLIRIEARYRDAVSSISAVANRQQGKVKLIYYRAG